METKEQTRTHWRKHLDPRYISGEDLKASLHGLQPEMVVCVAEMKDAPTFDQSTQKEVTKTSLWLRNLANNQMIYKPVILNVSNAKFFSKEFNSDFIEDWYEKPVVLFAMPDKRFGHVARFKHYYPPAKVTDTNALSVLSKASSLTELGEMWASLTPEEKKLPTVIALKDSLKQKLPA
jgi:hypothetical protein